MKNYTLEEFVAWCEGEGRGEKPGRHWQAIDAADRFLTFMQVKEKTKSHHGRTRRCAKS